MLLAVFYVASFAGWGTAQTIPETCDLKYFTHYKEFNCTPVFNNGSCPVKYNCGVIAARRSDRCYFNGTEYLPGQEVGYVSRACLAGCRCNTDDDSSRASTLCGRLECQEHLGPDPRRRGCRLQYEEDDCCAASHICPNEMESFEGVTCDYQGRTIYEGERFYPENKCKVCTCKDGFNGTLEEPWCKDIFCGLELRQVGAYIKKGCAPVYDVKGCCPISYHCPEDDNNEVVSSTGVSSKPSAEKCVFGSLQMNVNDKLSTSKACLDCTCSIPPFITCIDTCRHPQDPAYALYSP